MEKFEYNGIWWLPENPDRQISGILKFHPRDGAFLDLIGSFKDITQLTTSFEPTIILGFADGKKITLYKCYESRSHLNLPGFLSTSFYVSGIFVGHHFKREQDLSFDSLSINYSHLAEWTQITGFRLKMDTDSSKHLVKHEVIYSFPEKIETEIDKLNVSFDYNFKDEGDRIEEYKLKQTTFIKIEPDVPYHFEKYLDIFYHIQNFLSLGVGEAVYPLIIKGKNKECKITLQAGKVVYNDISVFYSIRNLPESSKRLHPLEMLFSFPDIASDFGPCLKNWFSKSDILKPVYDLYFATLYGSKMYLQHEFLTLAQALETYHRRISEGKYVSDGDYATMYEVMANAIPAELESDFRASLKERLKYLNEFSLRKRLREILGKFPDIFSFIIQQNEKFIEDAINTRNFLTHYDKNLQSKAKDGNELYRLVEEMKFVLEVCLLAELGISRDNIKALVDRNQRYQHLARQN